MNLDKLPAWLKSFVAFLQSLGGFGIFLAAFLDSSVLSLPVINDFLVIRYSIDSPALMPFYALMATLGSLTGSLFLYYLAKKGGEVMFRKAAGHRAQRIRDWVDKNDFLSIAIPSILPPPMPFKAFVIAAGVFQMRLRTFVVALLLGRGFRYFGEGLLAVRYGDHAFDWLKQHPLGFTLLLLGLVALSWLVTRHAFRPTQPRA
ncbi:MAG: VTT domain-containing protein [Acidobacteria bacterium]|nr:VTT domain-containing protein [Acidobacteriota bacterium]MBI3664528.1 VTT domain-containing protein [Acidobacteriota bacterium]